MARPNPKNIPAKNPEGEYPVQRLVLIADKKYAPVMEKLSLPKVAYNSIIDTIVAGTLKLGRPVSQDELAKMLNMSRTPLREALFALENEGILERNGRKYSIGYFPRKEVVELYDARMQLEAITTKLCTENITPELKRTLSSLLKKIKKETFAEDWNPYRLTDLNGRFHLLIAEGAGNRFLTKFLKEIVLKLKIVRLDILGSSERRFEEYDEHARVLEKILANDPDGAVEAMKTHREKIMDYTEEKLFGLVFYSDE